MSVAAGATLAVRGSDETVGALTGDGTVDLVSGRLTVTNAVSTFTGALAGDGTLRLEAGAELTLAQAPTAFTGYVELAGGALTLPDETGKIPATFRVLTVDPAKTAACAGNVEIADGAAFTVSKNFAGPLVTSAGRVRVMGGGSVTLANPQVVGTWTIGRGAEDAEDCGVGDLEARWTVTNLPAKRKALFKLVGGDFTCTVVGPGAILIVR